MLVMLVTFAPSVEDVLDEIDPSVGVAMTSRVLIEVGFEDDFRVGPFVQAVAIHRAINVVQYLLTLFGSQAQNSSRGDIEQDEVGLEYGRD